jgi:hypothetical protein
MNCDSEGIVNGRNYEVNKFVCSTPERLEQQQCAAEKIASKERCVAFRMPAVNTNSTQWRRISCLAHAVTNHNGHP